LRGVLQELSPTYYSISIYLFNMDTKPEVTYIVVSDCEIVLHTADIRLAKEVCFGWRRIYEVRELTQ